MNLEELRNSIKHVSMYTKNWDYTEFPISKDSKKIVSYSDLKGSYIGMFEMPDWNNYGHSFLVEESSIIFLEWDGFCNFLEELSEGHVNNGLHKAIQDTSPNYIRCFYNPYRYLKDPTVSSLATTLIKYPEYQFPHLKGIYYGAYKRLNENNRELGKFNGFHINLPPKEQLEFLESDS